jgi:hypothetical protein
MGGEGETDSDGLFAKTRSQGAILFYKSLIKPLKPIDFDDILSTEGMFPSILNN